jgi:hypothetical protein
VIEDDELVRGFVEDALAEAGFEAAAARTVEEGATLLRGRVANLHLSPISICWAGSTAGKLQSGEIAARPMSGLLMTTGVANA